MADRGDAAMPEIDVRGGVCRLHAPGSTWLSTGWAGGRRDADAAYNVSVPEGWARTDLDAYVDERLRAAGFDADERSSSSPDSASTHRDADERDSSSPDSQTRQDAAGRESSEPSVADEQSSSSLDSASPRQDAGAPEDTDGPALLTGVDMQHARAARLDADIEDSDGATMTAVATAGVSNPAGLFPAEADAAAASPRPPDGADEYTPGTVNLVLYAGRTLTEGALANLVAVVAEAKTATLVRETGFPGTTTDAVIVGCPAVRSPTGGEHDGIALFSGSGTPVGAAARACVRDAVTASLRSRYDDGELPASVADADHGVVTTRSATVFEPRRTTETQSHD
ncbi:adenosylcobinamide hydrolase [Natronoarchaeum philippinense]|uniref:Adenosylcobinamide hydrolase n=1 Tax=Natronoarchaeum philippinense TaxID=558529 RepID=A0A285NY73_NATPI|nr:adenosylcobinamide amidohydrolase [Natronoarchaeum philippinense]SNZ12591.1 adenosylcobinamide hydrolase [Natronoarchaeum philippinense]